MYIRGKLIAESPVYRGNTRKTLFTRDGDGIHRLVSLAGEISGTAQALMDAFIGQSRDGRNIGLLDRLWRRLYGVPIPKGLITGVECHLQEASYPHDRLFDLRMGLRLDEDRWAAEANANYKMETLFRNSVFDFELAVDEAVLSKGDHSARLYYLLQELKDGRFWFGAGKSKGLGRFRLEMDIPFPSPATPPIVDARANHLRLSLSFDAENPLLVGWNWGKIDPEVPVFAAIEGRFLVGAMRDIPEPIRQRLEMTLAGPILSPESWKGKFAEVLPKVIAIWLREQSGGQVETWMLPAAGLARLTKGKYPLSKKVVDVVQPLVNQPFPTREAAQEALTAALGDKVNMLDRLMSVMESKRESRLQLNPVAWQTVANNLGLDVALGEQLAAQIQDEAALVKILTPAIREIMSRLYQQVDQQVTLLQSDAWVDAEIITRQEHARIKTLLLQGKISEPQWHDRNRPPEGVSASAWRAFLDEHRQVRYQHLTNARNLNKSITNDKNFITFLQTFRERTRQELVQPYNLDFRAGGKSNRIVSRKYGKPYDTVFMRMLSWSPSSQEQGSWEIYIPGSTIKGALRRRASQVLKTLWGESNKTAAILERLFGAQGRRGLVLVSDAYLVDPYDPNRAFCTVDGVKMDARSGQPIEASLRDALYAYGDQLSFRLTLDLQDLSEADLEAFLVLKYLLQDFRRGEIPLGGDKTSGMGWVKVEVESLDWLVAQTGGITQDIFGEQTLLREGIWHRLDLQGEAALHALAVTQPLTIHSIRNDRSVEAGVGKAVPKAKAGFTSHYAFGGLCGVLAVEAETLTPLHIRESGEPSFRTELDDEPINGWDFFSFSPPQTDFRPAEKTYALPSKSLRGLFRHLYSIASDSSRESPDLTHLNPADSLFGWVGKGPNQAIMGRLVFHFGAFEMPALGWFKVPYPYGQWKFSNGQWVHGKGGATQLVIANQWRLFPHTPLAPLARPIESFQPDTAQASYFQAILPKSRARFTIRFWNLEEVELQRLVWCVVLESGLAHKMGNHRYLGFGSLRFHIQPESYLIDWEARYAGKPEQEWQNPLRVDEWLDPGVIRFYPELEKALRSDHTKNAHPL